MNCIVVLLSLVMATSAIPQLQFDGRTDTAPRQAEQQFFRTDFLQGNRNDFIPENRRVIGSETRDGFFHQNTDDFSRFDLGNPRSSLSPADIVPAQDSQVIEMQRVQPTADGRAAVLYETDHGVKVVENIAPDADGFNTQTGSYSYFDSEGFPVVVTYTADRDGYYATVPVPRNIPPHAAEQIRRGQEEHERARQLFSRLRKSKVGRV
ncbi:endocuticle structural glycoprotein SgAbd-1-like [Hyalella azteca]|uniref:Endocuticle structural glycoprotein SgAbd-1-like n=1 Tax=Hyalella azteca TaxID=294128 RepID=A0A979FU08_HYAAZ|nr:endocuticle structural glycoprotein SgAbd-1-like [Hyalella azteca]